MLVIRIYFTHFLYFIISSVFFFKTMQAHIYSLISPFIELAVFDLVLEL